MKRNINIFEFPLNIPRQRPETDGIEEMDPMIVSGTGHKKATNVYAVFCRQYNSHHKKIKKTK